MEIAGVSSLTPETIHVKIEVMWNETTWVSNINSLIDRFTSMPSTSDPKQFSLTSLELVEAAN